MVDFQHYTLLEGLSYIAASLRLWLRFVKEYRGKRDLRFGIVPMLNRLCRFTFVKI